MFLQFSERWRTFQLLCLSLCSPIWLLVMKAGRYQSVVTLNHHFLCLFGIDWTQRCREVRICLRSSSVSSGTCEDASDAVAVADLVKSIGEVNARSLSDSRSISMCCSRAPSKRRTKSSSLKWRCSSRKWCSHSNAERLQLNRFVSGWERRAEQEDERIPDSHDLYWNAWTRRFVRTHSGKSAASFIHLHCCWFSRQWKWSQRKSWSRSAWRILLCRYVCTRITAFSCCLSMHCSSTSKARIISRLAEKFAWFACFES